MSAIEKMKAEAIAAMSGPQAKNALAQRLTTVVDQRSLMALASDLILNAKTQPGTARSARIVYTAARAGYNFLIMEESLEEDHSH